MEVAAIAAIDHTADPLIDQDLDHFIFPPIAMIIATQNTIGITAAHRVDTATTEVSLHPDHRVATDRLTNFLAITVETDHAVAIDPLTDLRALKAEAEIVLIDQQIVMIALTAATEVSIIPQLGFAIAAHPFVEYIPVSNLVLIAEPIIILTTNPAPNVTISLTRQHTMNLNAHILQFILKPLAPNVAEGTI